LQEGNDSDVLVLSRDSLEIVEVIARGRRMVKGGRLNVTEKFLEESNRRITLSGQK